MKAVKPEKLNKGDLIGVISPASSPDDISKINAGVSYLEKNGFKVAVGKNVGKFHGYLAGEDDDRVNDLQDMFNKKEVKAVFCVRGGYGSGRLLNKIDYKIIKQNPKIFVGYSDITALQVSFYQRTGLITFAGPMLAVDFSNEISPFTEEFFWKTLMSNKKIGRVDLPENERLFQLTKGSAQGVIIGGNLAVLTSLMGTEYFPDLKQKILFLEDVGELPYRIDRMLNQLVLAKIFDKVNGIILGTFKDCQESDPMKKTLTLGEVISNYFEKLKKPVLYNFQHGHLTNNITIPFGIKIKMNSSREFIEYTENAVS